MCQSIIDDNHHFSFDGHERIPAFPFRGVRQIFFPENFNEGLLIKAQVGVYFAFLSQRGTNRVLGVVKFQENIKIPIVRFQMSGEGQRIQNIIMTGVNNRIIRQRHQSFYRQKKFIHVSGKTIADCSVEECIAGD